MRCGPAPQPDNHWVPCHSLCPPLKHEALREPGSQGTRWVVAEGLRFQGAVGRCSVLRTSGEVPLVSHLRVCPGLPNNGVGEGKKWEAACPLSPQLLYQSDRPLPPSFRFLCPGFGTRPVPLPLVSGRSSLCPARCGLHWGGGGMHSNHSLEN